MSIRSGRRRTRTGCGRRCRGPIGATPATSARETRTGHVWQGRFGYVAMDEAHLAAAIRHVAPGPVRARLVERPRDWRWSSVHAHLGRVGDDGITATAPVMVRFPDLAERIAAGEDEAIGRPVGDAAFIAALERRTSRALAPRGEGLSRRTAES